MLPYYNNPSFAEEAILALIDQDQDLPVLSVFDVLSVIEDLSLEGMELTELIDSIDLSVWQLGTEYFDVDMFDMFDF